MNVVECPMCGAMVAHAASDKHRRWHIRNHHLPVPVSDHERATSNTAGLHNVHYLPPFKEKP